MKLKFFISIFLFTQITLGQTTGNYKIKLELYSKDDIINDLMNFQKIKYYTADIQGKGVKDVDFYLVAKSYTDGKVDHVDTVLNTASFDRPYFGYNSSEHNKFKFSVMAQNNNSDSIEFAFKYPRYLKTIKFKKLQQDNYSIRDAISTGDGFQKIMTDSVYPILVYSLPYIDPKRPGYSFYCELTSGGTPPSQWGDKYGVKHYILFELSIRH